MKVGIGRAAKELGVSKETLRRSEAAGKIEVECTPKGHRRYDLSKLLGVTPRPALSGRPTLAYARVSSDDQKEDLLRQELVPIQKYMGLVRIRHRESYALAGASPLKASTSRIWYNPRVLA